jgi:hypothetical protein
MKVYRFLARSYFNNRIVEAGETLLLGDDVVPSSHMVDVAAESEAAARGEELVQPAGRVVPGAIFRSDIAYDIVASGGVPYYPRPDMAPSMPATITTDDGRVLTYNAELNTYSAQPVPFDAPVAAPEAEPIETVAVETPVVDDPVDAPATPAETAPTEG